MTTAGIGGAGHGDGLAIPLFPATPMPAGARFAALDSLRGLCAILVVLFHFHLNGTIRSLALVQNGWMFVDFFFVLSGFVIAHAYADRLAGGVVSVPKFLALRVGRIYPLHVAMILALVAMELLKLRTGMGSNPDRLPFSGDRDLPALLSNLLLLHSFGFHDHLTWNGPSWSIAAEMWAYILFAGLFAMLGRRALAVFGLLPVLALLFLLHASPATLDTSYHYGFVRCVLGFSLGVLIHAAFAARWRPRGTAIEGATILLVLLFASFVGTGPLTFAGPFLFAATVLVFASESGAISRLLRARPLMLLGTLSYSIYMVHLFVQGRILDVLKRKGALIGLTRTSLDGRSLADDGWAGAPWIADLLTLAMLALVIAVSMITYRMIELPAREWTRARLSRGRLKRTK